MKSSNRNASRLLFTLFLLSGFAFRVPTADASLKITTGNPGLEHFDADGGVQLDFGLTDQNGNPVGNLRPDNVKVFEDGKEAKILDFRGVGQGRPVDIVFVLDVTESMQPYIDAVKQNVISFAQDLQSNSRDYRLGLVTFEDYVVSAYPDCNCAYRNSFTSDVKQFSDWVGTLHAGGGGDIPEDQLDALAYAAKFPFRPEAEGIIIIVTDAPPHHDGDGSADTAHDQAFWDHHTRGVQVTDLTGTKVADLLKKNGLTLYGVVPPPFIAPEYQEIVDATHGRSYNIITEEGRFASLVREIGHSIATEYSLTYRTPRPIEDGTNRSVQLKIDYNGNDGEADTAYQVRGLGGAAINVPADEGTTGGNETGTGLKQLSFNWWNGAVPLIAILGLFGLSRMRFGMPADELKAIVEAQGAPSLRMPSAAPPPAARTAQRPPARPTPSQSPITSPRGAGITQGARLVAVDRIDSVPAEYSLMKDEISIGRGEDNDVVIPHASVSRQHARLMRRDGGFELMDLNSTNGSYVDDRQIRGSTFLSSGSQLRLGDIRFVLQL
ncbi:FHA domain-containing protein [Candidatus Binatus sp.]|uniref:FHA domain-containing protein n=4 Tax=Candidatus Binatus sp. TaxID=2811406 RepID=UPI003BB06E42